jgi:filamentous hemagglutinin family protein
MDERKGRSRYPDFMKRAFLWALLPTLVLVLIVPDIGDAQVPPPVTTSITSTSGAGNLGTTVTHQVGSNLFNIMDGTRPGNGPNLFHSFGAFTVGPGDIANFLNNTGLQTSNIIGRVTTLGNISYIHGTIQTTDFGNANLFLVNPSGIVFGPNGSVNVGGSVSFTTAQYLRLFDGVSSSANFYANPANDGLANSILAIDPSAFGFLSATPAAYGFLTAPDPNATITVQGSALSVPSGQSISLVGGKVDIQGAQLPDGTVQRAQLSAPNGSIRLATSASPGEFDATALFAGPNVENVSFTSYGFVSLQAGSSINVSGAHTVLIKGGQLVLSVNDATLNTSGSTPPQDTISLGPSSIIWTSNSGTDSSAPDLQLNASDVKMTGGALINSQTDGPGRGGDVNVAADRVTMEQGAAIFTQTSGLGAGGNVSIQGSQGAGSPADSVTLSGSSQVGNFTFGSGTGGGISITAKSLDLNGGSTLQSGTFGSGPNGAIVVSAQHASLSEGATFQSITAFSGDNPPVGGKITVQGLPEPGNPVTKANSLILDGPGTGLKTVALGGGHLGDIEVHAKTVSLMDGAVIQAGSPVDTATAGNVTIDADSVGLSGGSSISSHAFDLGAGQVTITANDQLTLDHSSIETNTSSPTGGSGGNVVLDVGSISLSNGATINSSSTGTGNAGNITINSDSNILMQNSSVTTEASQASGGQVTFTAPNMIQLVNSKISTSVAGSGTDTAGGNITIDPQFVILQNSQIIAQANAGSGGAINVTAEVFLADPNSVVDASSQQGPQGTVNIQSPVQNVGGHLTPLSQQFSSAAALLAQQCAARAADGKFSTFVVAGREGLPVEPGGFLASPSLTAELLGSSLSGRDRHTQFSAVTSLFPEYDARPIQLAKFGNACR